MPHRNSKYQRPWTKHEGYKIERDVLDQVYQDMDPEQQKTIQQMCERFVTESGVRRFGILSFLELIFKLACWDELDALAERMKLQCGTG